MAVMMVVRNAVVVSSERLCLRRSGLKTDRGLSLATATRAREDPVTHQMFSVCIHRVFQVSHLVILCLCLGDVFISELRVLLLNNNIDFVIKINKTHTLHKSTAQQSHHKISSFNYLKLTVHQFPRPPP